MLLVGSHAPPRDPSSHRRHTCSILPLMEADPAASTPGDGSVVNAPYRATRSQAAGAAPHASPAELGLLRGCEAAAAGKRHHLAAAGPGPSRHRRWGVASPIPHRPRSPGDPNQHPRLLHLWDTCVPWPSVGCGHAGCRSVHCGAGSGLKKGCKVGWWNS